MSANGGGVERSGLSILEAVTAVAIMVAAISLVLHFGFGSQPDKHESSTIQVVPSSQLGALARNEQSPANVSFAPPVLGEREGTRIERDGGDLARAERLNIWPAARADNPVPPP